jgi:multiple sugar transport system permease protein
MTQKNSLGKVVWTIALVALSLLSLVPFLWMISTSLKTRAEVFTYPPIWIPEQPQWENYLQVFEAFPFARYTLNTAFVTIMVTIFQTLTSAMAAYAFARLVFPGRDRLFLLYLGTLMIPGVVTLIPSYILMTDKFLNWINTYAALIVPASLGGAFNTFLIRQFFLSLPRELEDAALRITLPLSKSILAIVAIFVFIGTWNSFLWPLLMMSTPEKQVLTVGLAAMQGRWGTRWPELMAGTLMSTVPIILLLVVFQNYVEEGLSFTGLKA